MLLPKTGQTAGATAAFCRTTPDRWLRGLPPPFVAFLNGWVVLSYILGVGVSFSSFVVVVVVVVGVVVVAALVVVCGPCKRIGLRFTVPAATTSKRTEGGGSGSVFLVWWCCCGGTDPDFFVAKAEHLFLVNCGRNGRLVLDREKMCCTKRKVQTQRRSWRGCLGYYEQ